MASISDEQNRFIELVSAHQRPLLKIGWAYGHTPHDRADLQQEILRHLWAAFPKYDASRKFSTWMFRIALNVAIDFQRRHRRWRRTQLLTELETTATTLDVSRNDQLEALRELLETLSETDRPMLILHLEGHSHREIGEVFGISESNVGTRLHRLKQSLKQHHMEKLFS